MEQKYSNCRQMPSTEGIIRDKNYCDLLYGWLQVNSERIDMNTSQRRIEKSKIKWMAIERAFTRVDAEGNLVKIMTRKTIAKYFRFLEEKGFIYEGEDDYYYLTLLAADEAHLIYYDTLSKLLNVLQKNSINIYIYLISRWYANACQEYIITIAQVKRYIGISTSTTSNNLIVSDTLDILQRLGLIKYIIKYEEEKSIIHIQFVSSKLP